MAGRHDGQRWSTDGKFFRCAGNRVRMRAVTYGPFPGGWPDSFADDFSKIVESGFNSLRFYEIPDQGLLEAAQQQGLKVFAGLKWGQSLDFLESPGLVSSATISMAEFLRGHAQHPALAGIYVANEIPSDLVRWMGPHKVRLAVEQLISQGKALAPHLLFAYANYPSTEYLEPENADFTAFNVYLEDEQAFRNYLKRLHHIAGDRPLVISEFGLDSNRNGVARQAEVLSWATRAAAEHETAGMTIYAWSDRWWNAGQEVLDWDFGLINRQGIAKPAFEALQKMSPPSSLPKQHFFSVIICTRNGRSRIGACLRAVQKLIGCNFETIVVDDGSTDGTADFVAENFPWVRLLTLAPCGLSAARNAGAAFALGEIFAFTDDDCEPDFEWLARLGPILADEKYGAVGGPNLAPLARNWQAAVVSAAPGAPSHVLLDDQEAEHLPGCNIVIRKGAFEEIGGFDPAFRTAGDDVDFCWRLRDAGFRLGFAPGAFVWHWRRPSILTYLRQQRGYGRAERMLGAKHPARFSVSGEAKWLGFVYGGGPVRVMADSIIYHGPMGEAGYQSIVNRTLPLRGLQQPFDSIKSRAALKFVEWLQPRLRAWARNRRWRLGSIEKPRKSPMFEPDDFSIYTADGRGREFFTNVLIRNRWKIAGSTESWDLKRGNSRLLIATENLGSGNQRLLFRVWGTAAGPIERALRRSLKA